MDNPETSNRLPVLAEEINSEHAKCVAAMQQSLVHAMATGDMLIEAKALVAHGGWLPWLAQHCRMPKRTAQLYMRLAKHRAQIELKSADSLALLTMDAAVDLITNHRPSLVDLLDDIEAALNDVDAAIVECRKCNEAFDPEIAALAVAYNGVFFDTAETLQARMRKLNNEQVLIDGETDPATLKRVTELADRGLTTSVTIRSFCIRYAGALLKFFGQDESAEAQAILALAQQR